MKLLNYLLFIIILFLSNTLYGQFLNIDIVNPYFNIDRSLSLIVSQIDDIDLYNDLSNYEEITITFDGEIFSFSQVPNQLVYTDSYILNNGLNSFQLYFTQLPLINIDSNTEILDDPKQLATLTYADSEQDLTSNVGIEIRGGFSQTYPKKTYDLEFWQDANREETRDVKFGNMRSDDDWILDALYNEPLRLRSYVASKLWLDMHELYYEDDEPKAKSVADVMYIELFLNSEYKGLYTISEQVDRKLLKLGKYDDNEVDGELYKGVSWGGAVTYDEIPDYENEDRMWGGHEYKYPKAEEFTDWKNLYDFTDFVINSTDVEFIDDIWSKFNKENSIDYFLFLNLIRAYDNRGKNIYIARYKRDEPYFYIPWDLDGCLGTNWEGNRDSSSLGIVSNGFYSKCIELNADNYIKSMTDRWFDYRASIFETDKLIGLLKYQFDFLKQSKIYERESLVFPNYEFNQSSFTYTEVWLRNRLIFLDNYFELSIETSVNVEPTEVNVFFSYENDVIYISENFCSIQEQYIIFDLNGRLINQGKLSYYEISVAQLNSESYLLLLNNEIFRFTKI